MTRFRIEEIDPHTAAEDVLRSRHEAWVEVEAELHPEDAAVPFEQQRLWLTNQPSHRRPRHLVAWDGDGKHVIGFADLELEYTDTNRHLTWSWTAVRPEARRNRVGTALMAQLTELARLDGRTVIGAGSIDGHAGDAFAEATGFERKATERKSRLRTDAVDRDLMERWVEAAETQATDYELFAYEGDTPDDLIDDFVDLYHVTNTAPRDDLDLEDEVMTPERIHEVEKMMATLGTKRWRIIARHVPSGQLAGFTELFFVKHLPTVSEQGWTAVRPEHRNHGLGRWLKAVNILRLLDERPDIEAVDTWNAFSNGPMLAINIAMGFELLRGYNDWQAPTDRVAGITKQRLG